MRSKIRNNSEKRKAYPKTVWMRKEFHDKLNQLIKEGYFMNASEAMRTGAIIVILLSKLNPETLQTFRELTEELRKLNRNLEKIPIKQSLLGRIWKQNVIKI